MIYIPKLGWFYRAANKILIGPFKSIGLALKSEHVAKAQNDYKRKAIAWFNDYRGMEFNPQLDLVNEVYEKDIALGIFNTADEDLPF